MRLFTVIALCCSLAACSSKVATDTTDTADTGVEDTAPAYPPAPYSLEKDGIFPNLALRVYRDASEPLTDVRMEDYYDPDGSRGIRAVYVVLTAKGAPNMEDLAKELASRYLAAPYHYKARGGRVLDIVAFNFATAKPPTVPQLAQWIVKTGANYDVSMEPEPVVEPTYGSGAFGYPTAFVIDPRTMRIAARAGLTSADRTKWVAPQFEVVLTRNGAPPPG